MPVTVTVERHIAPGTQQEVKALLGQLWGMAKAHPGHIPGRTLVDTFNPGIILTVSEWTDLAARESWEKQPDRVRVVNKINALLAKTSPTRVWVQDVHGPSLRHLTLPPKATQALRQRGTRFPFLLPS